MSKGWSYNFVVSTLKAFNKSVKFNCESVLQQLCQSAAYTFLVWRGDASKPARHRAYVRQVLDRRIMFYILTDISFCSRRQK